MQIPTGAHNPNKPRGNGTYCERKRRKRKIQKWQSWWSRSPQERARGALLRDHANRLLIFRLERDRRESSTTGEAGGCGRAKVVIRQPHGRAGAADGAHGCRRRESHNYRFTKRAWRRTITSRSTTGYSIAHISRTLTTFQEHKYSTAAADLANLSFSRNAA